MGLGVVCVGQRPLLLKGEVLVSLAPVWQKKTPVSQRRDPDESLQTLPLDIGSPAIQPHGKNKNH